MRSLFLVALVVCACSPVDSGEASDVDAGGAGSSADSVSTAGASVASTPVKASSGGATAAASSTQAGGASVALGGSPAVASAAGGSKAAGGATSKGGATSAGGSVSLGGTTAKASTAPAIDQSCHLVISGVDGGVCGPATQGRRTCDAFGTCNVCDPQLGDVRMRLDCDFDGICEQRSDDLNCGACGYACPGGGTCHLYNGVYQCI